MATIRNISLLLCLFLNAGCSRASSIEDMFNQKHKNAEILFTHYLASGAIVFYDTKFENGDIGLGAAIFENKQGTLNLISSSATYDGNKISLDIAHLPESEVNQDLQYGVINDNRIVRMEIVDSRGRVDRATIIPTKWKRIWYVIGTYKEADIKAYSDTGDVVLQIPQK